MTLEESEFTSVENGMRPGRFGAATGILNIYHESTHAWLDLKEDTPAVATLIREGEAYYKAAPLSDGSTADDEPRLFQEAIAAYTGNRAASYWNALESLYTWGAQLKKPTMSADGISKCFAQLKKVPGTYNMDMARRDFGYQMRGWPWNRQQTGTKKPVSNAMKHFADAVLLENKISDSFSVSGLPASIWRTLQREYYPRLGG